MRSRLSIALSSLVVIAVLAACGGQAPAPATAVAPTAAPAATAPAATDAPASTAAPVATAAPAATATTAPATATEAPATATVEPAQAAEAGPSGQAAFDLLVQSARAQLASKAFRATITGKDESGADSTTVIEMVPPDSFHLTSGPSEFIVVPDGTFLKGEDGKWEKSPMDMSALMADAMSQQNIEQQIKDLKPEEITFLGPDLVGGKPAWIYQYKSKQDVGGSTIDTLTKMWIGALDKLPYKGEVASTVNNVTTTSNITYEYDDSITIEAPK